MTVIELFYETPIDNIIASLTTVPEKIIFIGESWRLNKFKEFYEEFKKDRKIEIIADFKPINKNNLAAIVSVLRDIVLTEDECIFDLTGGEDLVLVAIGMVYSEFCECKNIKLQRFNVRSGDTLDCDNDGKYIFSGKPQLSVEECIELHGGKIKYKTEDIKEGTNSYEMTEDFCNDIDKMWNICRNNPGSWNKQFIILNEINKGLKEEELQVDINLNDFKIQLNSKKIKYFSLSWFLKILLRNKLISGYFEDANTLKFRYKNTQVKRVLLSAGAILELKVFKTGREIYTDAMQSVHIDWDGEVHSDNSFIKDTENEIDVIFMDGIIPIFISCKNGAVGDEELYKFDAVASRFGGEYAKKVLIATYLNKKNKSIKNFENRAKAMRIKFIDSVHTIKSEEQFKKLIRDL